MMSCKDRLKQAQAVLNAISKGIYTDVDLTALPMGQQAFQQYARELLAVDDPATCQQTLQNIAQVYRSASDPTQRTVLMEMLKAYVQIHHDDPAAIRPLWDGVFGDTPAFQPFDLQSGAALNDSDLELCAELLRCAVPPTAQDRHPKAEAMERLEEYLQKHPTDLSATNAGDLALASAMLDAVELAAHAQTEETRTGQLSQADRDAVKATLQAMLANLRNQKQGLPPTQPSSPQPQSSRPPAPEQARDFAHPLRDSLTAMAERCAFRNQQNDAFIPPVPQAVIAGSTRPLTNAAGESARWQAGQPLTSPALIVDQMKEALLRNAKLVEQQEAQPQWDSRLGFGQYGSYLPHPTQIFTPDFLRSARERGAEPIDVALETLAVIGMEQGRRNRQVFIGEMAESALLQLDEPMSPAAYQTVKDLLLATTERGIRPKKEYGDSNSPGFWSPEDWPSDPRQIGFLNDEASRAFCAAVESLYEVQEVESEQAQGWDWQGLDVGGQWRWMDRINLRATFEQESLRYALWDKEGVSNYLEVIAQSTWKLGLEQGVRENFPADLLQRADHVLYGQYR